MDAEKKSVYAQEIKNWQMLHKVRLFYGKMLRIRIAGYTQLYLEMGLLTPIFQRLAYLALCCWDVKVRANPFRR